MDVDGLLSLLKQESWTIGPSGHIWITFIQHVSRHGTAKLAWHGPPEETPAAPALSTAASS